MNTYPWGPHGPQSSAHQVTPNPTQSYAPPPPMQAYNPVVQGGGGGYTGGGSYAPVDSGPPRKSYVLAVILSGVFGPLGLFYANAKAAKILLLVIAADVVVHVVSAPAGAVSRAGGLLSFIGDNAALEGAWTLATGCSVVLALLGVRSYREKMARADDKTAKASEST